MTRTSFKYLKSWHMQEGGVEKGGGNPYAKETKEWLKPIKNPDVARIKQTLFDAQKKLEQQERRQPDNPKVDVSILIEKIAHLDQDAHTDLFESRLRPEIIRDIALMALAQGLADRHRKDRTVNQRMDEMIRMHYTEYIRYWNENIAQDNQHIISGLQTGVNLNHKKIEQFIRASTSSPTHGHTNQPKGNQENEAIQEQR